MSNVEKNSLKFTTLLLTWKKTGSTNTVEASKPQNIKIMNGNELSNTIMGYATKIQNQLQPIFNTKWIKNPIFLMFFAGIVFLANSCATEEIIPVTTDFSIEVQNNDYTVPVVVTIKNKTQGAETFNWTFEGANITSSSQKNPQPITFSTKGNYKIVLKAANKDGSNGEKSIDIQIDAAMKADFDWQMIGSAISPVSLQMEDKSLGAISYLWEFENGNPASSTEQNPKVVFTSPGKHKIKLSIANGKESYNTEKTITVEPAMSVDFDWSVTAADADYEAPVLLLLNNKSTNAISYQWTLVGGNPNASTETHPEINFANPGTYTIILKATNDKESKTIQKQVIIQASKNLYSFANIKLGINTAHQSIGSFFSSHLGKVISKNEVSALNGSKIDFAFFGLNSSFTFNQFVSPDEVQNTAFEAIPNAIHTKIINSQELVGTQLSTTGFNAIDTGSDFNAITVSETAKGKTAFDNTVVPRIVLFQTADGRKGAIKITDYVQDGVNSYIKVDIKVQKVP